MKVFVFGKTGMLGNYVYLYFKNYTDYETIGITRKDIDITDINKSSLRSKLYHLGIEENDVIINCAGIIKQRNNADTIDFILVNSVFPHYLNSICREENYKFINISTDCTFSGKEGNYTEYSDHDTTDIYGVSKSLGEPVEATTIRTSIIGEELHNFCSLIEWVKSNKNKEVNGYINHFWNGVTCLQFAKICKYMIDNNSFWSGVRHITSTENISKYNLIKLISEVYNLNVKVKAYTSEQHCNRTLGTVKDALGLFIPSLKVQLKEQKEFFKEVVL